MEKIVITEEQVKKIFSNLLSEELKKVSRQDFSRVQFKIEELENSLNETLKEYRKLHESLPPEFRNMTNKKMQSILSYLNMSKQTISGLKENVKIFKKKVYGVTSTPLQSDNNEIKEHDVVSLVGNFENIEKYTRGTVIHIYDDDSYEVEFIVNGESITKTVPKNIVTKIGIKSRQKSE